jgi:hypothetical protein
MKWSCDAQLKGDVEGVDPCDTFLQRQYKAQALDSSLLNQSVACAA